MSRFLGPDFTVTKRQLGIVLVALGIAVVVGTLAVEWINGEPARFGTMQKMALLIGTLGAVVGVTLLPLGDGPA
jgi:predicted MFS family arabinose efflux permease